MSRLEIRSLPLRAIALQLGAAVALVAVTFRGLDSTSTATQVLQGLALLLAATLAFAVDEPGAEVLDATPTPYARRVGRRLPALAGLAAGLWVLTLALVALRGADVAARLLTLQAVTLIALGLAVAAALRRWRRMPEPGLVAGPVLIGFLIGLDQLPRPLAVMPLQAWGPPWEVTHLRWTAIALAALSVLLVGLSDPATAVRRRRSA